MYMWPTQLTPAMFSGQLYFRCSVGSPHVQRAHLSSTRTFNCMCGWCPNPCIVQGLAVYWPVFHVYLKSTFYCAQSSLHVCWVRFSDHVQVILLFPDFPSPVLTITKERSVGVSNSTTLSVSPFSSVRFCFMHFEDLLGM